MKGKKMIYYFYAIDGDDIGKALETYILQNDIEGVAKFSIKVEQALNFFREHFLSYGSEIIICSGDSLLAKANRKIYIPPEFLKQDDISFSIGIGNYASSSLLALKKAKGLGKNRIEEILGNPL